MNSAIQSLLVNLAILFALWLGRNWILTRLRASVAHEFDAKLEELRSDLRTKEADIVALRSGALSAMVSRQEAVGRRRLEAVDQLWDAVLKLKGYSFYVSLFASVKFEEMSRLAPTEPKIKTLFEMLPSLPEFPTSQSSMGAVARPFLTPIVWSIYRAIEVVYVISYMKAKALKSGLDTREMFDRNAINQVIMTALPSLAESVHKLGDAGYPDFLEALEVRLLEEVQLMLAGKEDNAQTVAQAAEVTRLVQKIFTDVAKQEVQPIREDG